MTSQTVGAAPAPRFAHYEILERVGRGGMGVVFRARDTLLGRPVAIKMLANLIGSAPESRRLLLREARAAASLNHPNIATIYEVGEAEVDDPRILPADDGDPVRGMMPYIAMEYVEGEDLKSRLRQGPLAMEDVVRIGLQIARGMEAAHRAKIVHRDLKPANVIVNAEGHVKLLDFGLAKFLRDGVLSQETQMMGDSLVSHDGVILGTVPYMAPEQLQGMRVDERSDLFSLGVILYEMAAGRPPFPARAPVAYFRALAEDHEPLSRAHPASPPELGDVVERLLAREPEERCQSAHEIVTELEALSRGDSTLSAYTVSPLAKVGPPTRFWRRPVPMMTLILAALLISYAVYLVVRPPPAREPVHLAVRPFENLTGDANEDDVAHGISEVLIAQLRRLHGLSADVSDADADRILRGEVRRQPGRFVVDVRLDEVDGEVSWWSQRYEFASDGILGFQVDLARDVVRALGLRLTWRESWRLRRAPTSSVQAFELYLQALSFMENPTSPHLKKSEERLRQAIELDDGFSLAHAALSEVLWQIYARTGASDEQLLIAAENSARRADELETVSPEAQIALARIYRAGDQRPRALYLLKELRRQYPSLDEVHRELAITYRRDGQLCSALANALKAVELDRHFWRNWYEYGTVSTHLGDYEVAREAFQKAADLAPPIEATRSLHNLVGVQVQMADYQGAIETSRKIPQPITDAILANNLGSAYFFAGMNEHARKHFEMAIDLTDDSYRLAFIKRNLGDVLMRQGALEMARDEYYQALDVIDRMPDAPSDRERVSLLRSLLLAKVDECYTATKAAEDIQSNIPDSVDKFTNLAQIYALCDHHGKALGAFENALDWGARGNVLGKSDEFQSLAGLTRFQELAAREPRIPDCSQP